ncbi:hypothetical protein OF83DRAFT_1085694 [Amylostereum chailletii]|nr:hypothetical protein OF83DRAFT_1085694 [Amylostereum chailletii]
MTTLYGPLLAMNQHLASTLLPKKTCLHLTVTDIGAFCSVRTTHACTANNEYDLKAKHGTPLSEEHRRGVGEPTMALDLDDHHRRLTPKSNSVPWDITCAQTMYTVFIHCSVTQGRRKAAVGLNDVEMSEDDTTSLQIPYGPGWVAKRTGKPVCKTDLGMNRRFNSEIKGRSLHRHSALFGPCKPEGIRIIVVVNAMNIKPNENTDYQTTKI